MDFKVPIAERDQQSLKAIEPVYQQKGETIKPFSDESLKVLDSYADVLKERAKKSEAIADYAFETKLKNDVDSLKNKATAEVISSKGENAFVVADKVSKSFKTGLDKLLNQSPERLKYKAEGIARNAENDFEKVSIGHQYKQQNEVLDRMEKDRVSFLSEQIPLSAYDGAKFNEGRSALLEAVEIAVRRNMGGDVRLDVEPSPEIKKQIQAEKIKANSSVIVKTIESLVAQEDLGMAKKYAATLDEELLASDKVKVDKLLLKGAKDKVHSIAKIYADEAISKYNMDLPTMEKFLRDNIQDGEIFNAARAQVESYYNANEKYRADVAADKFAAAQDKLRKNGYNISAVKNDVDPRTFDDLKKWAVFASQGGEIPRNHKLYNEMMDMYQNNPKEFAKVPMGDYVHKMSQDDFNMFRSLQNSVLAPQTDKRNFNEFNYITDRIMRSNLSSDPTPEEKSAFYEAANRVFSQLQNVSQGRMTDSQFSAEYQKHLIERTSVKDKVSQWKLFSPSTWGTPDKEVQVRKNMYDLAAEEDMNNLENIGSTTPWSTRDYEFAKQQWRATHNNQEPTHEQVQELLNIASFRSRMRKMSK